MANQAVCRIELGEGNEMMSRCGIFLARVGPLAMLVAIVGLTRRHAILYEYPREGLMMG